MAAHASDTTEYKRWFVQDVLTQVCTWLDNRSIRYEIRKAKYTRSVYVTAYINPAAPVVIRISDHKHTSNNHDRSVYPGSNQGAQCVRALFQRLWEIQTGETAHVAKTANRAIESPRKAKGYPDWRKRSKAQQ